MQLGELRDFGIRGKLQVYLIHAGSLGVADLAIFVIVEYRCCYAAHLIVGEVDEVEFLAQFAASLLHLFRRAVEVLIDHLLQLYVGTFRLTESKQVLQLQRSLIAQSFIFVVGNKYPLAVLAVCIVVDVVVGSVCRR